jgi:hypothetical protein
MQNLLRILALAAIALSLPACATHKKADCCSASTSTKKCDAGDASCHAPTAKKKSN